MTSNGHRHQYLPKGVPMFQNIFDIIVIILFVILFADTRILIKQMNSVLRVVARHTDILHILLERKADEKETDTL